MSFKANARTRSSEILRSSFPTKVGSQMGFGYFGSRFSLSSSHPLKGRTVEIISSKLLVKPSHRSFMKGKRFFCQLPGVESKANSTVEPKKSTYVSTDINNSKNVSLVGNNNIYQEQNRNEGNLWARTFYLGIAALSAGAVGWLYCNQQPNAKFCETISEKLSLKKKLN